MHPGWEGTIETTWSQWPSNTQRKWDVLLYAILCKGFEYLWIWVSASIPCGYQGTTKGKGLSKLVLIEQEKWQDAKVKKMIMLASRVCSPSTERARRGKGRDTEGREGKRRWHTLKGPRTSSWWNSLQHQAHITEGEMDTSDSFKVTQLVWSRAEVRKKGSWVLSLSLSPLNPVYT